MTVSALSALRFDDDGNIVGVVGGSVWFALLNAGLSEQAARKLWKTAEFALLDAGNVAPSNNQIWAHIARTAKAARLDMRSPQNWISLIELV